MVSTSTRNPSSKSRAIDGRSRVSRGSVDRQTSQSHPIIGTPCEVPVPRNSTRTNPDASIRLGPERPDERTDANANTGRSGTARTSATAEDMAKRRPRAGTRASAAPRGRAGLRTLVRLMDTLRSPRGCPWDREQTHETLRPFLLEETYEALDALDRGDMDALPGELGDVLFQCVFHSQLAAERGQFDLADAIDQPVGQADSPASARVHRVGPAPAAAGARGDPKTPEAVLQRWEVLKAGEQASAGREKRVLAGIPRSMPALLRAHEIGTRPRPPRFRLVGRGLRARQARRGDRGIQGSAGREPGARRRRVRRCAVHARQSRAQARHRAGGGAAPDERHVHGAIRSRRGRPPRSRHERARGSPGRPRRRLGSRQSRPRRRR